MSNALGVLQELIKQKRKDAIHLALMDRVINLDTISRFDDVATHHDYNALPKIEQTKYLEFVSMRSVDHMQVLSGRPEVVRKRKPISNGGINDAHYNTSSWLPDAVLRCPALATWRNMLERCSSKVQAKHPTYVGCTVAPEWYSFMTFRAWWLQHYKEDYHLDKDLLVPNNKVYSPNTCLFVPPWLNTFCTARERARGLYPLGVSVDKRQKTRPYQAMCSNGAGRTINLGLYATPEEAHQAWLNYKLSIVDARSAELEAIRAGLTDKVKAKVLSLV